LIREIHATLLAKGPGSDKQPGELPPQPKLDRRHAPWNRRFRSTAGGKRWSRWARWNCSCMRRDRICRCWVKAGLVHVRFKTIHPFLDGNGRMGRLLIVFMLCAAGVLREPILYPSLYFKTHRQRHYELLDRVRTTGD
jgi:hypothetical protein